MVPPQIATPFLLFGIDFGNECNEGWTEFWNFVFVAPRKSGRSNNAKRIQSPLEQIKKKPGKVPIQQQMETHAKKLTKTMGAKSSGAKHGRNGKKCE